VQFKVRTVFGQASNVGVWPFCDMPPLPRNVRFEGRTGSGCTTAK
jgi:hypothetical protein